MLQAALASGTWVSYRKSVEKFIEFRIQFALDRIWPIPEAHILLFISFLSKNGYAPSTINSYMAALSFVHKVNGWQNSTETFLVKKLKEGCRRNKRKSDGRLPITPELLGHLAKVLPSICKSLYEAQLFKAAFLLAFFGFLRVGEISRTNNQQDTSRLISINDVSISNSSLNLRIRYSKTDQCGNSFCLQIEGSTNVEMCPVTALSIYLKARPSLEGPLFIHFNGETITSAQFSHVLKRRDKVVRAMSQLFWVPQFQNRGSHSSRN